MVKRGTPHSQVSVIPNACEADLLEVGNSKRTECSNNFVAGRVRILYVGTLGLANAVDLLLDALSILKTTAAVHQLFIEIRGDGKYRQGGHEGEDTQKGASSPP